MSNFDIDKRLQQMKIAFVYNMFDFVQAMGQSWWSHAPNHASIAHSLLPKGPNIILHTFINKNELMLACILKCN